MIKFFLFLLLSMELFSSDIRINSLTLEKIKRTVQKEEAVAYAYKKYLIDKASVPSIDNLKKHGYLPPSFSLVNPFGRKLRISNSSIQTTIPNHLKSNLYDYYYSNKYRKYTKAPANINSNIVKIKFTTKEKYFINHLSEVTLDKNEAKNKFYLDKGVLHWYNNEGIYQFSFDKDLIVDETVTIRDENDNLDTTFKTLLEQKGIYYPGLMIYQPKNGVVEDYIITGKKIVQLDEKEDEIGKTVIQFSRRSGGMMVNGDLYTWGNNLNKITSINSNVISGKESNYATSGAVINTPVRVKINDNSYFSSPLRTKFKDFFASVFHGVCGVSVKGELYCSGVGSSGYKEIDPSPDGLLYKSTFFDGVVHKAKKVFANDAIWTILSDEGDVYSWGRDANYSGFSGSGNRYFSSYEESYPYNTSVKSLHSSLGGVKFQDITYTLTLGKRKIAGLSTTGDIYVWGAEGYSTDSICDYAYEVDPDYESYDFYLTYYDDYGQAYYRYYKYPNNRVNLCIPKEPEIQDNENITFTSLSGGLNSFIAKDAEGNYYKIYDDNPIMKVINIKELITFNENIDKSITWADTTKDGVVWINENHELKGDYFSSANKDDNIFKNAIEKIKWKQIKVISENNGMCGIDVKNQMYCWGVMYHYRNEYTVGNTIMMPVFNSNLYDLEKDFLLMEGKNNYLTAMTSDDWLKDTNTFFIKYPTYIGGFNYEFEFK